MYKHVKVVHEGSKLLQCNVCDQTFILEPDLKKHIAYVHEGKQPFECNQCETNFEREIDLKAHIRSFHEGKKVLAACGCPKTHLTSIIDNAYLSLSELAELKVLKDSISDHYPIIVNLSTDVLSKGKLKTIFRRDITRLAVSDFEDALIAKDWSPLYMITDPDEALTLFLNKVNEALDVVAPIKAIKIRPDKPKISLKHDTLATMASRDEARKKGNKTCYKILRNKASKLVKRDKIQGILKNLIQAQKVHGRKPKSFWGKDVVIYCLTVQQTPIKMTQLNIRMLFS